MWIERDRDVAEERLSGQPEEDRAVLPDGPEHSQVLEVLAYASPKDVHAAVSARRVVHRHCPGRRPPPRFQHHRHALVDGRRGAVWSVCSGRLARHLVRSSIPVKLQISPRRAPASPSLASRRWRFLQRRGHGDRPRRGHGRRAGDAPRLAIRRHERRNRPVTPYTARRLTMYRAPRVFLPVGPGGGPVFGERLAPNARSPSMYLDVPPPPGQGLVGPGPRWCLCRIPAAR